jgi:hypothetical protein
LSETRVDHWLHDPCLHFWWHHGDHLNHRVLVNLRGDDPYWELKQGERRDVQMKMKRRDGWMGAMICREPNLWVAAYHPFRTPLFKFVFDAL